MIIRILIYEGRQHKVCSVKITETKLFSNADIAEELACAYAQPTGLAKKPKLGPNGLKMDTGDTFTPDGLNDDMKAIGDFYGAKGYIDVAPYSKNLTVEKFLNTTGTTDPEFRIDEGQKPN